MPADANHHDTRATPLAVDYHGAALLLSVSRRTIDRLVHRGDLHPINIGRCRRILRADLVAYVDRLRAGRGVSDG